MGNKHILRCAHVLIVQVYFRIGIQALKNQCRALFQRVYRKRFGVDPVFVFDPLHLLSRIPPINVGRQFANFHQIGMYAAGYSCGKTLVIRGAQPLPYTIQ